MVATVAKSEGVFIDRHGSLQAGDVPANEGALSGGESHRGALVLDGAEQILWVEDAMTRYLCAASYGDCLTGSDV